MTDKSATVTAERMLPMGGDVIPSDKFGGASLICLSQVVKEYRTAAGTFPALKGVTW